MVQHSSAVFGFHNRIYRKHTFEWMTVFRNEIWYFYWIWKGGGEDLSGTRASKNMNMGLSHVRSLLKGSCSPELDLRPFLSEMKWLWPLFQVLFLQVYLFNCCQQLQTNFDIWRIFKVFERKKEAIWAQLTLKMTLIRWPTIKPLSSKPAAHLRLLSSRQII